jgi:plastocyanin domain-containing protein
MPIDKIIVIIIGLLGMAGTYWFFLMKKDQAVEVSDSVDIIVDGGYSPSVISVPLGKTTKISFFRKDPNSCLEDVVLGDFKIRKRLPMNQKVTVEIKPEKKGEFNFSCGMGMFHGKVIVK